MTCNCIERVNAQLKETNKRISGLLLTFPELEQVPTISTEWIDPSKAPKGQKNKCPAVGVPRCPFCGQLVSKSDKATRPTVPAATCLAEIEQLLATQDITLEATRLLTLTADALRTGTWPDISKFQPS